MKLLADENQHPVIVHRLRKAGYQVEWVAQTCAGMADGDILRRGDIASLVLLTFDRDFGDLIFNRGYPAPRAILYTRLSRARPEEIADRLLSILAIGVAPNHMTTIIADGERLRPFPPGAFDG